MNLNDTLRALKDRAFRQTVELTEQHPAGISAIDESQFDAVSGGTSNNGCGGGTGPGTPCLKCEF